MTLSTIMSTAKSVKNVCGTLADKIDNHNITVLLMNIFVNTLLISSRIPQEIPPALAYTTILYRLMYELSLDLFDKPNVNINILSAKSPPLSRDSSLQVGTI